MVHSDSLPLLIPEKTSKSQIIRGNPAANEARERDVDIPLADPQPAPEAMPGFLGISVAEVPDMLAAHLDLPKDTGVLVRIVGPGSPAEKAGLRLHDIVLEVADRPVSSHQDLLGIVGEHRAGDDLKIKVSRKGDIEFFHATLDARPELANPAPGADPRIGQLNLGPKDLFFEDLPQDHAARIRGMIEQNLRALRDPGGMLDDDAFQGAFQNMREQMERLLAEPKPFGPLDEDGGFGNLRMNAGATVRLMDDQGSIELKAVNESKEVTVRDMQNDIIWTGPWDTEQDKAAAPDEIRERIERLNIEGFHEGNGLRLQFFRNR
jgi:serine protease Do